MTEPGYGYGSGASTGLNWWFRYRGSGAEFSSGRVLLGYMYPWVSVGLKYILVINHLLSLAFSLHPLQNIL